MDHLSENFIVIKHTDDVTIFQILKEHILTEDYDEVKDQFDKNLAESRKKIVIDLKKVEYISSLILTSLMYMLKKSTEKNKVLVLTGVQPKIKDILTSTSLDKIFTIEEQRTYPFYPWLRTNSNTSFLSFLSISKN